MRPVLAIGIFDQIDARNMCIDAAWYVNVHHFRAKLGISVHFIGRNFSGFEDVLLVIYIVQKEIERGDPLF